MAEDAVTWTMDARGVVTVTLNRPERNNAYNGAMIAGLAAAVDALEEADTAASNTSGASGDAAQQRVRAVVVTGAGRCFQAGADLDWLADVRDGGADANSAASRATAEVVDRFNQLPVPTFAAVHGACIGGGTGLLAAADVVVAADTAKFAISEVRWGLTAAIIVPHLIDAIGARNVRRYAITGERFDADDAARIGLVHDVVPEAQLHDRVAELVAQTLGNAPDAIAETKAHVLAATTAQSASTDLSELIEAHARKRQSAEAGEGIASFKEKRPARWTP
ncbi:MAG: enoyl-CoA hydratase-related protein, partial [Pseudomonadota bacterium]